MKLDYQGRQLKLHQRATCLLELLKKAQSEQARQEGLLAELNDIQKRILKSYYWLVVELYDITENFILPVNRIQ